MAQQSVRPRRKTYGNVYVKGRARVHLGDSHIINNYNVNVKTDELIEIIRSALADSNATQLHGQVRETTDHAQQRMLYRSADFEHHETTTLQRIEEEHESRIGSQNSTNIATRSNTFTAIQALYEFIHRNLQLLKLSGPVLPMPQLCSEINVTGPGFYSHEEKGSVMVTQNTGHAKALRDLLLLLAAALSCLLGRNVSTTDLVSFAVKCKHDQILPLLTFALGIGLYRLFAAQAVLSAPVQHFVILEDAYARSLRVSMDILVDFSVLNSFLKVHYHNAGSTAGERLIVAGQYHIMLGSRRGMVMGRVNWTAATKLIKPGSRLINSVYLDSVDAACFNCRATLAVSVLGDFHCTTCDVFYRDDAALEAQLLASVATARSSRNDLGGRRNSDSSRSRSESEMELERVNVNSLLAQHDFGGLRHLDLRIIPPTQGPGLDDSAEYVFEYISSGSSHTGTVKWFNDSKGFGFITPNDGGEELFVHFSVIRTNGFRTLHAGQSVAFEIVHGPKGKQASNVYGL